MNYIIYEENGVKYIATPDKSKRMSLILFVELAEKYLERSTKNVDTKPEHKEGTKTCK